MKSSQKGLGSTISSREIFLHLRQSESIVGAPCSFIESHCGTAFAVKMELMREDSMWLPDHTFDIYATVEELHCQSSQEMNLLLEDADDLTLYLTTQKGASLKVNIEKLAWHLPLHLLAVLVSSNRAELHLRYLLCGVRLLHSLSDLASQHAKLEQILLEELNLTEQIIDLVFYLLVVLAHFEQEGCAGSFLGLCHAALVACSLHLLTAFVSPHWQDVVDVLLAHPKVDIFMDAAFDSVRKDIGFFQLKMRALNTKVLSKRTTLLAAETTAYTTAQQCEASLEALHSLCLQKSFRERLLRNEELCENGGSLSLALSILKLQVPSNFTDSTYVVASVSRLKSKILSMLLQLCESESCSYLDKVANSARSMHLAVSVISEVLDLLKVTLRKEPKQFEGHADDHNPKGYVLLNSMRLVDNLSNDTNFRSLIINNITGDLVRILALPPDEFLSSWCAADAPVSEGDATLVYDPFLAAGAVMVSLESAGPSLLSDPSALASLPDTASSGCTLTVNFMPPATHAQQRTSSLVNILANLHCYVPGICKEVVKNQFFNKFLDCLVMGHLNPASDFFCGSEAQTTVRICNNLCTLRDHALSLIPELQEEDVQVLSEFLTQLQTTIFPEQPRSGTNQQEAQCCTRASIDPMPSVKEQMNSVISVNKDTEGQPFTQIKLENNSCLLYEDSQATGEYRLPTKRKQETNTPEESMDSCIRRGTEDKDVTEDAEKISIIVDIQEIDHLKGLKDKHASTTNEVTNAERNGKEDISSNCRSNVQCFTEDHHEADILKVNSVPTESETDDDEILRDTQGEIHDIADGEKEEIGAGVVVRGSEEFDTNTGENRQSRKRSWRIINDKEISEEINTDTGEDREPRKRTRRFAKGKQLGSDTNRAEIRRSRKKPWRIMNDRQIAIIEEALQIDPDMQKNRDALQSWTEELKKIGPEFKIRQLRKWIYNRKDKLARDARAAHAAREARTSDGESMLL